VIDCSTSLALTIIKSASSSITMTMNGSVVSMFSPKVSFRRLRLRSSLILL